MAAVNQQRLAGTGSRITWAVPEGVDAVTFYDNLVTAYGTTPGDVIPAQTEVAFVSATAFVVDLLNKPHQLGFSAGAVTVAERTVPQICGRTLPPRIFAPGYKVGAPATRRDWDPRATVRDASAAVQAIDTERATMALAQLSVLREIVSTVGAREVRADRSAGNVGALVVGGVIVLSVAFDLYMDHLRDVEQLRAESAERTARAAIAQSGQDLVTRLAQYNATGTMPPPSAAEQAVAGLVRQRAQSEWETFWAGASATAGKVGKVVMIGGGLALAAVVFGGK